MNTSSTEIYLKNIGGDICCPFFDKFGSLHIVFSDSGEIAVVRGDDVKVVHSTNGQTSSALYDDSGMLYITDYAHSAVLMAHQNASDNEGKRDFILGSQEVIVGFYEDRPLRGPSSIAIDKFGNIVFTDSGPLGDTGLHSPKGSLFIVSAGVSGQLLKPIVFEKLAFPSAVVFSPDGKFIYVAEMMSNRILRFFQKPNGVYHGSVFHQLSGGVGPSSLAVDARGNIYVGCFEIRGEASKEGRIVAINSKGEIFYVIKTYGPEISGLAINRGVLYVTEKSTSSIQKYVIDEN